MLMEGGRQFPTCDSHHCPFLFLQKNVEEAPGMPNTEGERPGAILMPKSPGRLWGQTWPIMRHSGTRDGVAGTMRCSPET